MKNVVALVNLHNSPNFSFQLAKVTISLPTAIQFAQKSALARRNYKIALPTHFANTHVFATHQYSRSPKMVVPMRTIVEPSSTAMR